MTTERVDLGHAGRAAGEADEHRVAAEFGRRIVRYRKRRGWQQAELAQRLRVTRMRLGHWERGVHSPPLVVLLALQRELAVSFDELLLGEPSPELSRGEKAEAQACLARLMRLFRLSGDPKKAAMTRTGP
jgi:transcriptional regulator with XRE-family HTH domain